MISASYRGRRERFPPYPLAASGEKELRGYLRPSKLTRSALASATRLLRSRPYCSGALGFANIFCSFPSRLPGSEIPSLAPCALGGDRLAMSVCVQKPIETVFAFPQTGGCRLTFPATTVSNNRGQQTYRVR